jgi:F0F1-type ATP synthase assembly protein I
VEDDGSLGGKFWLKAVGLIILIGIAAMIFFIIVGNVWARSGFLGVMIVVFGTFLVFAYISDRKKQKEAEEWAD